MRAQSDGRSDRGFFRALEWRALSLSHKNHCSAAVAVKALDPFFLAITLSSRTVSSVSRAYWPLWLLPFWRRLAENKQTMDDTTRSRLDALNVALDDCMKRRTAHSEIMERHNRSEALDTLGRQHFSQEDYRLFSRGGALE